ncbi:DNA-binding protein-like protein HGH1 [Calycina marina]|uniref:Protein HGH1 homolog n=1 Tax=Calycina marina TaxID=1763456 RepID=A0A9P7YWX2_9HELO|nr:DNA-binding protein-like protein HGH1 [Calycina marina]
MPTELEELVEFVSHGNTEVRKIAVEHLVPYSISNPLVFQTNQLQPVTDLKLLVRDYKEIAKNALTILINLSSSRDVLQFLATDKDFMKTLLTRIGNPAEPNANEISMLLANLAKHDELKDILHLERPAPNELNSNNRAIDQLLDLFVKGADETYNKEANFDYLSYLFADLAKHPEGRKYFLTKQEYDGVVPLSKLIVFTEHKSDIRRKGVASAIKNVAFEIDAHPRFLDENEINILPYLLLPIMGKEEYDDEDSLDMLADLQLLPPDKQRDSDTDVIQTHIETLMLLTMTRGGRDVLRSIKTYPIIRECHMHVEDDGVREACERLVQVLMRDEEGDGNVDEGMKALVRKPRAGTRTNPSSVPKPFGAGGGGGTGSWATQQVEDESDDDKIIEM